MIITLFIALQLIIISLCGTALIMNIPALRNLLPSFLNQPEGITKDDIDTIIRNTLDIEQEIREKVVKLANLSDEAIDEAERLYIANEQESIESEVFDYFCSPECLIECTHSHCSYPCRLNKRHAHQSVEVQTSTPSTFVSPTKFPNQVCVGGVCRPREAGGGSTIWKRERFSCLRKSSSKCSRKERKRFKNNSKKIRYELNESKWPCSVVKQDAIIYGPCRRNNSQLVPIRLKTSLPRYNTLLIMDDNNLLIDSIEFKDSDYYKALIKNRAKRKRDKCLNRCLR